MIPDPAAVLGDGLGVLTQNIAPLSVFIFTILGVGALVMRLLPDSQTHRPWRIPLTLGLGCTTLPVLTLPLMLVAAWVPALLTPGGYFILALAAAGLVLELRKTSLKDVHLASLIWIGLSGLAVILLLILRLAFLKFLLLPPYDDSPEHYLIIKDFLLPGENPQAFYSAAGWLRHYYHLGFHSLAAWLVLITGTDIGADMVLLGQVFLLIAPLSVYTFTAVTTRDDCASWVAALFAAIGWRMPAFAANWGKYPALMAIACLPAVLSVLALLRRPGKSWTAFLLAAGGVFLAHTRAGLCLFLGAAGFAFANLVPVRRGIKFWESSLLAGLFILAGYLLYVPLISLYSDGWYLELGLLILCLPFAIQFRPRFSAGVWLGLLGIGLLARLELPQSLQFYSKTVLDRTFVEMLLFVPLSLLAGVGLAGLFNRLGSRSLLRWTAASLVFIMVTSIFWMRGAFYPDVCCNYVRAGDLEAMTWIQSHTPPDAAVLVAGFQARNYQVATDGGGWVQAVTGRNMNKVRYNLNWSTASARELVCKKEWAEPYIYAGGMEFSFIRDYLYKPEWYQVVFESRGIRIYKVQGCQSRAP